MASQRSTRITRRTQQKVFYSDFKMNFDLNPITNALERLTNNDAVKSAIKNLVMTQRGERFYHLDIGSDVPRSFFDLVDDITATQIGESIHSAIKQHERRAHDVDVRVIPDIVHNTYTVDISFGVINIPEIQTLQIILNRVR